jgi:hypothetical protein
MIANGMTLAFVLILIIAVLATVTKKLFSSKLKKEIAMRPFVPVEPTIQASQIVSTAITTTATFDDGLVAVLPSPAVDGDYVIQNADGSLKVIDKATFEAQFKPA